MESLYLSIPAFLLSITAPDSQDLTKKKVPGHQNFIKLPTRTIKTTFRGMWATRRLVI